MPTREKIGAGLLIANLVPSKNSFSEIALDIIHDRRKGRGYDLFRTALSGLSALHGVGLNAYLFAEHAGIRKRTRLPVPVISIGNITSGGTGKTPMTALLINQLVAKHFKPVVLSRGHGGSIKTGVGQVSDSTGRVLLTAAESGDESALLARLLAGVPVFVGRDRRASASAAISAEHPDVIVLDDGMQYWQLARNLDIALVDARRPFDNGYLLPRGALREPPSHLKRAGVIVITRANLVSMEALASLAAQLRKIARASDIFISSHEFGGLRPLNDAAESVLPVQPLAVCAIAQPKQFFAMLQHSGIAIAENRRMAFEDHKGFDHQTLKAILKRAKSSGADSIVMTEKDSVKIDCAEIDLPCYAVKLTLTMDDLQGFFGAVFKRAGIGCAEHAQ